MPKQILMVLLIYSSLVFSQDMTPKSSVCVRGPDDPPDATWNNIRLGQQPFVISNQNINNKDYIIFDNMASAFVRICNSQVTNTSTILVNNGGDNYSFRLPSRSCTDVELPRVKVSSECDSSIGCTPIGYVSYCYVNHKRDRELGRGTFSVRGVLYKPDVVQNNDKVLSAQVWNYLGASFVGRYYIYNSIRSARYELCPSNLNVDIGSSTLPFGNGNVNKKPSNYQCVITEGQSIWFDVNVARPSDAPFKIRKLPM